MAKAIPVIRLSTALTTLFKVMERESNPDCDPAKWAGLPKARKRNRKKAMRLLWAIRRGLDLEFPLLLANGEARKPAKGCACPICKVPFRNKAQLGGHFCAAHTRKVLKRYWISRTCICGKCYKTSGRLGAHVLRHDPASFTLAVLNGMFNQEARS